MDAVGKGEREDGAFGFSPRYVMNQLSRALARTDACLSGSAVLDTLWEGLTQRAGFGDADRTAATEVFAAARAEYDNMVKRTIQRALVPNYERQARTRARDALRDLESWDKGGEREPRCAQADRAGARRAVLPPRRRAQGPARAAPRRRGAGGSLQRRPAGRGGDRAVDLAELERAR